MTPNKENTIFLTIKQKTFDNIKSGKVKFIQREIKENTFELYLEHEGEDMAYDPDLISYEPDDLLVYNNGVYPFYPIEYRFANLTVISEDEKKGDTMTIEIEGISFEVMKNKNGVEARFDYDDEDGIVMNKFGSSAYWLIVYHFGNIIKN